MTALQSSPVACSTTQLQASEQSSGQSKRRRLSGKRCWTAEKQACAEILTPSTDVPQSVQTLTSSRCSSRRLQGKQQVLTPSTAVPKSVQTLTSSRCSSRRLRGKQQVETARKPHQQTEVAQASPAACGVFNTSATASREKDADSDRACNQAQPKAASRSLLEEFDRAAVPTVNDDHAPSEYVDLEQMTSGKAVHRVENTLNALHGKALIDAVEAAVEERLKMARRICEGGNSVEAAVKQQALEVETQIIDHVTPSQQVDSLEDSTRRKIRRVDDSDIDAAEIIDVFCSRLGSEALLAIKDTIDNLQHVSMKADASAIVSNVDDTASAGMKDQVASNRQLELLARSDRNKASHPGKEDMDGAAAMASAARALAEGALTRPDSCQVVTTVDVFAAKEERARAGQQDSTSTTPDEATRTLLVSALDSIEELFDLASTPGSEIQSREVLLNMLDRIEDVADQQVVSSK